MHTIELPDLDDTPIDEPIVRYPDHAVYTRRHGRRYGLGTYSHEPIPLAAAAATAERPYRESDFGAALAAATALVPAFRSAGIGSRLNGAFALTPDELPLVGAVPDLPGLWVAEASWVTHAGGVGRHLTNLLLGTGDPVVDPARMAPDRFAQWSDERVRITALAHYRGIYDAH
ncbi:FAD-dependent oxidoreductase [Nocardia amamiensis]|uniref:FAD-dependent oxidoreductase n=1 Tax=Nocardia amamiensis TaxID=404578 RepID=UPI002480329C|nr:FAD-dependent oxidoreductase [Nocardia amamiensis]